LLSVLLLFKLLKLEGGWSAEVKYNSVSCKLAVGMFEGFKTLLNVFFIKGVKEDLFSASSINGKANLTASDA
jgi:hypothetical protein